MTRLPTLRDGIALTHFIVAADIEPASHLSSDGSAARTRVLITSGLRKNADGSITEIPPERCPNGHELTYPNVIVAHWPKPGAGKLVRAWYCKTCKATIYDD